MNNINQIIEDLEQYKQNGGDMNALAGSIQPLFATGKTPLGLNQWVKSDKPTMVDFNEDNKIIDEEIRALKANKPDKSYVDAQLGNKVNLIKPTKYKFQTTLSYENQPYSYYCKTQEGVVILSLDVLSNSTVQNQGIIATLPEGFRPQGMMITLCSVDTYPVSGNRTHGTIRIEGNGSISYTGNLGDEITSNHRIVRANISFVAQ